MIFFDIETVFDKDNKQDLNSLVEKYGDEKTSFLPELTKILTICVGYQDKDGIRIKNIEGTEEEQITKFFAMLKIHDLCGFNILSFDIPFIVKRAIKYKIAIPERLKFHKKPARKLDYIIDLQNVYKMNVWGGLGNLDMICKFLGINTPKNGMNGKQVQDFHDEGKDAEIIEYCKKDVEANIDVYNYFLETNLI